MRERERERERECNAAMRHGTEIHYRKSNANEYIDMLINCGNPIVHLSRALNCDRTVLLVMSCYSFP